MATVNDDDAKKLKIRLALEKMKEAKMKKVYVKIFLDETTSKGILVDERWTAATTMRHLAEKASVTLTPEHSIVEEYPHLHISKLIIYYYILGLY
jgi:amyloid beta A4 precursor protein-binding family B protein 1-interacting protein